MQYRPIEEIREITASELGDIGRLVEPLDTTADLGPNADLARKFSKASAAHAMRAQRLYEIAPWLNLDERLAAADPQHAMSTVETLDEMAGEQIATLTTQMAEAESTNLVIVALTVAGLRRFRQLLKP